MNKKVQSILKGRKCRAITGAVVLSLFAILSSSMTFASSPDDNQSSVAVLLQQKTVTLSVTNKPIRFILNEVKKQTGINFIIDESKLGKSLENISVSIKNQSAEKALEMILKNTGYGYRIENNVIILEKLANKTKISVTVSQKMTIEGTVLNDEDRKAIGGATILIEGSSNGAITDGSGRFSLNVSKGDVLLVTYVGKIAQKIVIDNDKPLMILMKNDAMALDDVVITGFANVKRSSYTGNAVTIKRDEILKASKTNVVKALETFDPSFRIRENNQWGSDPNALPEVNIRGGSSIGVKQATFGADGAVVDRNDLKKSNLQDNPNLPTFIMDGFQISVTKLYDFDPNRIESITILKDAAATALYGSRAANGVVVITTVSPKPGKLNVAYSFVGEVTMPDLSDYNLLNASEKLEVERLAGCYNFIDDANTGQNYLFKLKEEYYSKQRNIARGVDTYWLSQPLRSLFNHQHSLYVDGGTDNLRFGMDVQYKSQDGIMKESFRDRLGAGFYIQYNYKNLSIKNYTSFLMADAQESPYGSFSDYAEQLPYDTFLNDDGTIKPNLKEWSDESTSFNEDRKINPLYEPNLNNFDRSKDQNLTNNLDVNWNLFNDLLLKVQFSVSKEDSSSERFYDPLSLKNSKPLSETVLSSGELYLKYGSAFAYDLNATASYNKQIDRHAINILAGYNIRESSRNGHSATYEGFPTGMLSSANYAQKQRDKTSYNDGTARSVGVLASLNYSFDDIYMLDASIRYEGSSAFGADKRFAPFWSFGAGVNIHNYKFMKESKVFDLLKIRGSYGQVGNANFSPYEALITYDVMSDEWYKTGYGSVLKAFGNRGLKWETTNTFDVGFELRMFDNLLYLRASYYDKKTVDVINDVTIPSSTGFTSYKDNIGQISNRGYELDLRIAAVRTKDVNLYLTANLAHNKGKIIKISESMKAYNKQVQDMYTSTSIINEVISKPLMQYQEGGSLKSIWGVPSLGINPADGNEVFMSRSGRITDKWISGDQVIIGNEEPTAQGSLGFTLTYKQFSFYTSFMYQFGAETFNQTLMDKVENANVYVTNVDKRVLTERWREAGQVAKYKGIQYGRGDVDQTRPSSRFIQSYNMLSWNSAELSYDFNQKALKKLHLGMLRLTLGMNDVFHLSTVKQERGLSYPYARTFNFSLKTSF